ncbi:MAG: transglycosylase SLT domain-containing protein [Deltaproteobacteria bacterium]|nr:transglycosylase SLT domain-containing protein [Deltaproteobacteria bacterium]
MNSFLTWICYPSRAGVVVFLSSLSLLSLIALTARADDPPDTGRVDTAITYLIRLAPNHPMGDGARRHDMATAIATAAEKHGIPWDVLTAMAYRETSLQLGRVGPAGEIGPIQVHPDTARHYRCDTSSPASLIDCGAFILSDLRAKCGGRLAGGLASYCSRDSNCNPKPGSKLRGAVNRRLRLARKLRTMNDGN